MMVTGVSSAVVTDLAWPSGASFTGVTVIEMVAVAESEAAVIDPEGEAVASVEIR